MRIDRFDLIAYGHFTGKSLDFSAGDQGLHLIYGDNEAGKSTSLRALIAWLFGIPVRTNDNYLHSNPQLRLGGKLRLLNGDDLEFVRRKGAKGTLLRYGTDEVLDDSVLLPFLPAGIDERLFTKLHGIDHGRLVAGGQELLQQSGDIGQALLSAAVGTAGFREILFELQKSADELFRPRGSTKPLVNQTIASFKEARKKIREASLPVVEWKRLQKELAETLSRVGEVEDDLDDKSREKNRLTRCNRVRSVLAERRVLLVRIATIEDVLLLPDDFAAKCKMWDERVQVAEEARKRAVAKMSRLEKETHLLNVRYELLENEEAILALYKELGAVEKTLKDRPRQDGKRRLLRNEAEGLLRGVHPHMDIDEAEQLRPLLNNKKWLAGLAKQHGLLAQKRDKAVSTLKDLKNEQELAIKELGEQVQANVDLSELQAAVAAARKSGDLEQRLADMEKRGCAAGDVCRGELSRLGRFTGTIDTLLQVAMPVSETLDVYEKQLDKFTEELRDCKRKQQDIGEEKKQAEHDIRVLLSTGEVPTLLELKESRTVRDGDWDLLKRKYILKNDVRDDGAQISPAADLTLSYEQKVDGADRIADQLRLAADQVAKRIDLEAKVEDLASRLIDIDEKKQLAAQAMALQQKEWQKIWQPMGIIAGTPREMKQWLLKVETLLGNVQAAKIIADDVKKLTGECVILKKTISYQIGRFDSSVNHAPMNLEEMITLCEQRIEKELAVLERRRQLQRLLNDCQVRRKRIDDELQSIDHDQINWEEEWSKAIDGLGLQPDVHPERATETFDRLVAFFEKFDQSEDLRKRIFGIDQVVEKFNTRVLAFADGVGYKKDGQVPVAIAAQLNRDLNEAREARAGLQKIAVQRKEIQAEIEEVAITIQTANDQLATLRVLAGVQCDDELESANEKSRNKRELLQRLDTLERELVRSGDGLSLDELEKENSESDSDIIENELERVSTELKELQAIRDVLRDKRQTLRNEIQARDGSGAAAEASEDAEQHKASLISGVEQYLRMRIAALILEQKIEDYRKKNQAPVLAKAAEIFSRITLGSYRSLRDELDDGKPILLGVRPDDTEVPVSGMSDGSRDQLYLALRLATLEQQLDKGEPLPFIVDDILIGFDDNRSRVCLDVLAEFARKTQVLLFTHHQRVIEIAKTIDGDAGLFVHALA